MRGERKVDRRGGILDPAMIISVGARRAGVRGVVLRLRRLVAAGRPSASAKSGRDRDGPARKASAPRAESRCTMIVLGIDPGVANTGYGVVAQPRRAAGRARRRRDRDARRGSTPGARLAAIHARVGELIDEHRPRRGRARGRCTSAPTRARRSRSARRAASCCSPPASAACPCASYTPQQVKGAVCGSGRAAKDQVQRMVQTLLALPSCRGPTTRPTRSRSRSATPTARRCAAALAAA